MAFSPHLNRNLNGQTWKTPVNPSAGPRGFAREQPMLAFVVRGGRPGLASGSFVHNLPCRFLHQLIRALASGYWGAWNWIVLLRTLCHLPSTVVTWRALFLSIWHRVLFSRLHVSSCPDRVSLGRCAHLFLLQCLWPYFRWGFLVSISIHSFIRSPHRVVRRGGTSYMRNQCGLPQVHHRDSFHTTIISL